MTTSIQSKPKAVLFPGKQGWITIEVDRDFCGCSDERAVHFGGQEILLLPGTEQCPPCIRTRFAHPQRAEDATQTLLEFASAVTWATGTALRVGSQANCTAPLNIGRGPCTMWAGIPLDVTDIENLTREQSAAVRRALAHYRVALSNDDVPSRLHKLFLVLNVCFYGAKDHRNWIDSAIQHLGARREWGSAVLRANALVLDGHDLSEYLWGEGRCSLAHAHEDPTINPDSPDDLTRLHFDFPLVRALAELAIETKLGVPRPERAWGRSH